MFRVLDDQPAPLRIEDEAEEEQPATTDEDIPAVDPISADESDMKRKRRSRNSMYYASTGADALLEIRGSKLEGPSEESSDDPDDEEISAESDIEEDSADDRYETATNFPAPSSPTLAMRPDLPRPGLTKQGHTHDYQRNASEKGLMIQVTDTSQDATRRYGLSCSFTVYTDQSRLQSSHCSSRSAFTANDWPAWSWPSLAWLTNFTSASIFESLILLLYTTSHDQHF